MVKTDETMKKTAIILLAALLLSSCEDAYTLRQPTLEVDAPATVTVGPRVEFSLSGAQDILSFWSGEPGSDYTYREKDRIGSGDTWLSFSTTTASGTKEYPNPASVPFSWSTDFSGKYTEADMNAATWHDITDEFEWPTVTPETVSAGELNVNGILPSDGTPVYFRFYYHVAAYSASAAGGQGNGRTQWTITKLNFDCDTPAGRITAYNMYDQRWQLILGDGCSTIPESNLPSLPTTAERILFRSQFKPDVDLHIWAVSGAVTRPGDINLGHDKGVGIKAIADPQMKKYYYTWNTPGEYRVVFVGVNAGVEGRREVVREMTINVVQDSGNISGPVPENW